jgi:thymidylate kinase
VIAGSRKAPHFVVFEGVDGTGKTTFAEALARYYQIQFPEARLLATSFPGSAPGTLGELVYKLHHGHLEGAPKPRSIAGPALQLLHVAAHVDAIVRTIAPMLAAGDHVILDRYWWSTYAYVRRSVTVETAWRLIGAESPFWVGLPTPIVVYLERRESLKPGDLGLVGHKEIAGYYEEVVKAEQTAGVTVLTIRNEDRVENTWEAILKGLHLAHYPFAALPESDDRT